MPIIVFYMFNILHFESKIFGAEIRTRILNYWDWQLTRALFWTPNPRNPGVNKTVEWVKTIVVSPSPTHFVCLPSTGAVWITTLTWWMVTGSNGMVCIPGTVLVPYFSAVVTITTIVSPKSLNKVLVTLDFPAIVLVKTKGVGEF